MDESVKMQDALMTQRMLAQCYTEYMNICTNKSTKNKMLKLMAEEQDIQLELLGEMNKRGYLFSEQADSEKIAHICNIFNDDSI
ncbi:spore coat protein [uncultured Ruthenibacterium sp.]|uniref:spore coat protein n=1 Tax=uncultured Ruthenibacterium sp. TaxID=1905347 RepID=UPI00349EFEA7